MKRITLTQGKYAIVDDEDFEYLNQWKWCFDKSGYARRNFWNGRSFQAILMHRLVINTPKSQITDHVNGDKLDNRKINLRFCSIQQNLMNQKKRKGIYKSQFKGVGYYPKKYPNKPWVASIRYKGKVVHLGSFANERHAAMAYDLWALTIHQDFANTNFKIAYQS